MKSGKKDALKNYLKMLSQGGSNYPVEIVKTAGVDLTKTDAFEAVVRRFKELLKELKELLNI